MVCERQTDLPGICERCAESHVLRRAFTEGRERLGGAEPLSGWLDDLGVTAEEAQ
jgi:hypothetical protein